MILQYPPQQISAQPVQWSSMHGLVDKSCRVPGCNNSCRMLAPVHITWQALVPHIGSGESLLDTQYLAKEMVQGALSAGFS
jgi:hypothetical protein